MRIGGRLNGSLDNLWFTVLFKRPAWFRRPPAFPEIVRAARLFEQAMTTGLHATATSADESLVRALGHALDEHRGEPQGVTGKTAADLLASAAAPPGPWGWKEPNTHVFLPTLNRVIPGLRYVHVVRDGLDMAFSRNIGQLRNWGCFMGFEADEDAPLPVQQLRFWIAANRVAVEYGACVMGRRFLLVSYEAFCADPERQTARLMRFLGHSAEVDPRAHVAPKSIGRAAEHDLSIFPADDLAALAALRQRLAEVETLV